MESNWYDNRMNLQHLAAFLDAVGLPVEDSDGVAYFLEKPYKWQKEWDILQDYPDWNNYSTDAIEEIRSQILEAND